MSFVSTILLIQVPLNPKYPPVTYNLKADHISILGRVVGIIWAPLGYAFLLPSHHLL